MACLTAHHLAHVQHRLQASSMAIPDVLVEVVAACEPRLILLLGWWVPSDISACCRSMPAVCPPHSASQPTTVTVIALNTQSEIPFYYHKPAVCPLHSASQPTTVTVIALNTQSEIQFHCHKPAVCTLHSASQPTTVTVIALKTQSEIRFHYHKSTVCSPHAFCLSTYHHHHHCIKHAIRNTISSLQASCMSSAFCLSAYHNKHHCIINMQ